MAVFGFCSGLFPFVNEFSLNFPKAASGPSHGYTRLRTPGIGQGITELTRFEGALLAAGIADKEIMPTPVLLRAERKQAKRVLNEGDALQLQRVMVDVVKRGTGRALANFTERRYKEGVKTGTVEKIRNDGDKTNIAWIIGFAGRKELEIAFAVVVEDTQGYAGKVCSPIVRSVLTTYFPNAE
jgi:penicillin-binding protein A